MLSRAGVGVVAITAGAACGDVSYIPWWDGNTASTPPPGLASDAGPDAHAAATDSGATRDAQPEAGAPSTSVFFVLMAYHPWSDVAGSGSAPYINGTLLAQGAHAEAYYAAPPRITESEPNVVWLEAGDNLGITANGPPGQNHRASTAHLVDQLEAAGVGWRAYLDHMTPGKCPIAEAYPYRTFHVPFLFFDDVVGDPPSASAKRCLDHVVPLTQLASDLKSQSTPRYAFIVPDMCDDMHDDCNTGDPIRQGDEWLHTYVPQILSSAAYGAGGVVFIAWDFSPTGYVPIGLIALSPKIRAGHASHAMFTTSSTLRTIQELLGVGPPLGDAANAQDLASLFTTFPP